MATKQIRKQSISMLGILMGTIIVMAIFYGSFIWLQVNVSDIGDSVDSRYNNTYERLSENQEGLEDDVEAIRDNLDDISEADNTFQAAWNGLKGLGNTIKLQTNFIGSTISIADIILDPLDILPGWASALLFLGLLTMIVLLIISIFKGDPNMV